jgi:hypothetical protein
VVVGRVVDVQQSAVSFSENPVSQRTFT